MSIMTVWTGWGVWALALWTGTGAALHVPSEAHLDAYGWMRAKPFRVTCAVQTANPTDVNAPNPSVPFEFVVDIGTSHTVVSWKAAAALATARDPVLSRDAARVQWVRAPMRFSCGPPPTPLEFVAPLHVAWAVPPKYEPQSGPLTNPVLGLDVLRDYNWCLGPRDLWIVAETTQVIITEDGAQRSTAVSCAALGVSPGPRLTTVPLPSDGLPRLTVRVRTAQHEWEPMEFLLCSGSELTAFRADDPLYIGDEEGSYTETVDTGSEEELAVKGFPCNVAIGRLVIVARCSRFLDAGEDRCLGRDVLSRLVLEHRRGEGIALSEAPADPGERREP